MPLTNRWRWFAAAAVGATQRFHGNDLAACVGKQSFVDRVDLSIDSEPPIAKKILDAKDQGIFNPKSFYARRLSGKWSMNGNPVKIVYGKASRFPQIPACRVFLRSEERPWTGAQANLFLQSVFPNAVTVRPTLVELTSDVSTISFSQFRRTVVHRAWYRKVLGDSRNGRTLYIGSPRSPLQARIYEKRPGILRHELVLRRKFLADRKMRDMNSLARLSSLQTWPWLSLRKYSRDRVVAAMGRSVDRERIDMVCGSGDEPRSSLQNISRYLRARKIDPDGVLFLSRNQVQLEKMLRNFVW